MERIGMQLDEKSPFRLGWGGRGRLPDILFMQQMVSRVCKVREPIKNKNKKTLMMMILLHNHRQDGHVQEVSRRADEFIETSRWWLSSDVGQFVCVTHTLNGGLSRGKRELTGGGRRVIVGKKQKCHWRVCLCASFTQTYGRSCQLSRVSKRRHDDQDDQDDLVRKKEKPSNSAHYSARFLLRLHLVWFDMLDTTPVFLVEMLLRASFSPDEAAKEKYKRIPQSVATDARFRSLKICLLWNMSCFSLISATLTSLALWNFFTVYGETLEKMGGESCRRRRRRRRIARSKRSSVASLFLPHSLSLYLSLSASVERVEHMLFGSRSKETTVFTVVAPRTLPFRSRFLHFDRLHHPPLSIATLATFLH